MPGTDSDDLDSDPITESNDLKDAGDGQGSHKILMDLCQTDLRCLDAHAHLGNFVFDHRPADAIRHYEAGLRIGELSLGDNFDGLLPWGHIDNRPLLRCMHGFGLCLWRLDRFEEAERVFDRMLWLTPSDNTPHLHPRLARHPRGGVRAPPQTLPHRAGLLVPGGHRRRTIKVPRSWIVDPEARTIEAYGLAGQASRRDPAELHAGTRKPSR